MKVWWSIVAFLIYIYFTYVPAIDAATYTYTFNREFFLDLYQATTKKQRFCRGNMIIIAYSQRLSVCKTFVMKGQMGPKSLQEYRTLHV